MTSRLALLICVSVCLAQTAFGLKKLSPMERIQQRSVPINGEEITIVPLIAKYTMYLKFTLTKCGEIGVSYIVLPSLPRGLDTLSNWTQLNDTVTKNIYAGHHKNPKGMMYLALKHSASVGRNASSFVILQTMCNLIINSPPFSFPNSKVQFQWNATTKKVNVTFPELKMDWSAYSGLGLDDLNKLTVKYRMIATTSEKFTTEIAKCGDAMITEKMALIDMNQPLFYLKGTVSFELQPTEPVYYITLIVSAAKHAWKYTPTWSWEVTYYYPVTKYEVPVEYIQRKN